MQVTGNTMLITGGGSGIGRALAEAFHRRGNEVIIAGRREDALRQAADANPGMKTAVLDVQDPASIERFAARMAEEFPTLNVVIHNAGIIRIEDWRAEEGRSVDSRGDDRNEPARADSLIGGIAAAAQAPSEVDDRDGVLWIGISDAGVHAHV